MKGILVVISAPSGAGKSTIIRKLLEVDSNCRFAVSHTTRTPRPGEVDGVDYYFVDRDRFEAMVAGDMFAEWANVHGNLYGTSLTEIDRLASQGIDVVFEVDYQGGRSLMRLFPEAASIFVLPPSMAEVRRRLTARGTDAPDVIETRMHNARVEIATAGEYRFVVINDDIDTAVEDVRQIIRVEKMRAISRAAMIRDLVAEKVAD